jgi:hypothetical protein
MVAIHTRLATAIGPQGGREGRGGMGGVGGIACAPHARLVLQIHDEFLLEVPGEKRSVVSTVACGAVDCSGVDGGGSKLQDGLVPQ